MDTIYLDNAATTKPLGELKDLCNEYLISEWYNPSALYKPGVDAEKHINEAADLLLKAFESPKHRCLFTSGGTESANTVILRGFRASKNADFVCGGAEHPCIEQSFKYLETLGYPVKYVKPDDAGLIDIDECLKLVGENTALVSIMHINNETGAKNDISGIAKAVKAKNPRVLFHSDGVQAFLRESTDTAEIDYYTVSAHKVNAFKGTGAIFYKPSAPLKPYILGGGQQGGLRSGTENTLGIYAFGKACQYYMQEKKVIEDNFHKLRNGFLSAVSDCPHIKIISPSENCCDHIISISAVGVAGETVMHILEEKGIYLSTGSACSSKKGRSRIAKALNLSPQIANGMLRVSFSLDNTLDEVTTAANEIKNAINILK